MLYYIHHHKSMIGLKWASCICKCGLLFSNVFEKFHRELSVWNGNASKSELRNRIFVTIQRFAVPWFLFFVTSQPAVHRLWMCPILHTLSLSPTRSFWLLLLFTIVRHMAFDMWHGKCFWNNRAHSKATTCNKWQQIIQFFGLIQTVICIITLMFGVENECYNVFHILV